MLYSILLVVQVVLSIGLIVLVLLQHGKGADAGAAFGSGASATVFGARGSANLLTRATALTATGFIINSLVLTYLVANRPEAPSVIDLIDTTPQRVEQPASMPPEDDDSGDDVGPVDVPN
ncbi:preprotein translocase subunit SecG [Ectothiorhodospira haloalkaliphila]|uniref:Protein-export membrane protein SecG n=1 Tax=Ectothiorhodospira haloalkaliphila TaxID=421628 RepID=W8L3R3_9GAMM|nr:MULTISPECIES: preprotein translocase subunit SecG [Ectothiorhodospira]AHK78570.1 preprotein translocase subunit SecG [Ectothiorhodospira haloalkaliphila]MCG5493194.1 preprotein translocase subunit SecG [Ectothiorhodospira variabilis]MCG5497084.1 preprotein translocase subunit SecG [Ectothiorhodospira variabilis]MCG5502523.1 preprotein translocase subunit SecG [Ectothiorhodospira variabilis]MCG5505711.1 preprotein translocase subunit SecG [Ectothiorhodospira variabilis]